MNNPSNWEGVAKALASFIDERTGSCPLDLLDRAPWPSCSDKCQSNTDVSLCWLEWAKQQQLPEPPSWGQMMETKMTERNPCKGCDLRDNPNPVMDEPPYCNGLLQCNSRVIACGPYAKYLGYQEGLAECEARIQRLLERLDGWPETASMTDVRYDLREWLKGEA